MNKKKQLLLILISNVFLNQALFSSSVVNKKKTNEGILVLPKIGNNQLEIQLIKAAKNDNFNLVKIILNSKPSININYQDPQFKITPLMHACTNNNLEMVKLFLTFKPDLNLQDCNGNTALMKVITNGNTPEGREIFRIIINTPGINLNLQNIKGTTVLIMAVDAENQINNTQKTNYLNSLIHWLIMDGADPNITNNTGKKAIDYTKNPKLKTLLKTKKSISFAEQETITEVEYTPVKYTVKKYNDTPEMDEDDSPEMDENESPQNNNEKNSKQYLQPDDHGKFIKNSKGRFLQEPLPLKKGHSYNPNEKPIKGIYKKTKISTKELTPDKTTMQNPMNDNY